MEVVVALVEGDVAVAFVAGEVAVVVVVCGDGQLGRCGGRWAVLVLQPWVVVRCSVCARVWSGMWPAPAASARARGL